MEIEIMNKVSMVSLVILSSLSLSACGNSGSVNSVPVPIRMTTVSLDSSACEVRPETKVQGYIEPGTVSDFNKVVTTPVVTPVKTNLNVKTESKTETKTDSVDLGDDLPEVKAPPATDVKTPAPEEKPKTKVGQLIDKVKNIFKKKS